MAEWIGAVITDEESVRSNNGKAHLSADEVGHVRVSTAPLLCKHPCKVSLGCLCVLGGHAIDGVDKWGKFSASFKAGGLVIVFLLLGMALEDFA